MGFDILGARQAGYTDDQIADYLAEQRGIDVAAARAAGYKTRDLMAELSDSWAKQEPLPGVQQSDGRSAAPMSRQDPRIIGAQPAPAAPTQPATVAPIGLAAATPVRRGTIRAVAPFVASDPTIDGGSVLDKPAPAGLQSSLIEQRGSPVSKETFSAAMNALAALPREVRLAQEQRADLPAWQRAIIAQANAQLDGADMAQQGRIGLQSPTIEGRTARAMAQGADLPTAQSAATAAQQAGLARTDLAQATPIKGGLLTPEEERANKAEGEKLQRASIGTRGLYQANEGMVQGTAGLIAAALRATGDDRAAEFYEKTAQGASVRAKAAQELRLMKERARDSGLIPAGLLGGFSDWAERQATGAVNSVGQMIPGMIVGMATGSPGAGMAMMALPVFGQSYTDKRNAGGSPGEAAMYGGLMSGLEAIGERYGLLPAALNALKRDAAKVPINEVPAFLERGIVAMEARGLFSKPVGGIVRGQVGEQIGEQITGAGQYFLDGTALGLDKPISLAGFLENARDTAVQTMLATGVMQGAGKAGRVAMGERSTGRNEAADATDRPAGMGNIIPPEAATAPSAGGMPQPGQPVDIGAAVPPQSAAEALTPADALGAAVPAAASRDQLAGQEPDYTGLDTPAVPVGAQQQTADAAAPGKGATLHDFQADQPVVAPVIASRIDERAHAAATSPTNDRPEPTQAQKEAGNYAKGHVRIAGIDFAIENPQGSVRRGVDPDGKAWETPLVAHYGYTKGTRASDGDHSDVFIKPGTPEDYTGPVFVIDQVNKDGTFDEHKTVIGAESEEEARRLYQGNYAPDWRGLGAITQLPIDAYKSWVRDGVKRKPLGDISKATQVAADNVAEPPRPGATLTPRVIGKVGRTPNSARSIELRPNKDGTLTPHDGKYPMVDFDTGEPIRLQSATTDAQAADAIKKAGAISTKDRFYGVKPDAPGPQVAEPAGSAMPEPAKLAQPAAATPAQVTPAAGQTFTMDGKAWTIDKVGQGGTVSLVGDAGNRRTVAPGGSTHTKIMAALVAQATTAPESAAGNQGEADGEKQGQGRRQEVLTPPGDGGLASRNNGATTPGPEAIKLPKVYKDRGIARAAAKAAGNTMKVRKVKDGFILTEKTDAELAAESKATKRAGPGSVDTQNDSLLTAIARLGGLDRVSAGRDLDISADDFRHPSGVFGSPVFRANGGQTAEHILEAVTEYNYLPLGATLQDLADAVGAELRGRKQMSMARDIGADLEVQAQAERDRWAEDDALADFTGDDLVESGYTALSPEEQAATDLLMQDAEAAGIDTESIVERVAMASDGDTQHAYNQALQQAVREALAAHRGRTEQADDGAAAPGDGRSGRTAGQEGSGQEDAAQGLTLEAQTAEDLRAKAERDQAAEDAARRTKAAEQDRLRKEAEGRDNKARADQTVDDFQLGQTAEQQMSGMGDLFAEPEAASQPNLETASTKSEAQSQPNAEARPDAIGWDSMDDAARTRVLESAGLTTAKGELNFVGKRLLKTVWADIADGTKATIERFAMRVEAKPADTRKAEIRPYRRADGSIGYEAVPINPPAAEPAAAPAAATRIESGDTEAMRQAKADLMAGLGDLAALLSKNTRANITPEQEQALLPILTKVMDASFRMGHLKFKQAARFVLDQIRAVIGNDVADMISLEHLQGSYIGMAGKYRDQGADRAATVAAVESLAEITDNQAAEAPADDNQPQPTPEPALGANDSPEGRGPAGERGAPAQQPDPRAHPGDVEGAQPGDVGAPAEGDAGRLAGDGVPGGNVGPDAGAGGQRASANRRPRAGRKGAPDARTGELAGRPASEPVDPATVSPANTGPGDFVIADPLRIVGGGQVARFEKNKAAIELRNRLVDEGRQPTREEQEVLAGYTGWGSFGQELFQGNWDKPKPKEGWEARDQWLRENLGRTEWEGMQTSIINAHYTDPPTVLAMWDMVRRMGFTGGRMLEPSIGAGNFFGMQPVDLAARSQRAGIELDPMTGSIAQMLYPNANIQIKGYEQSNTPDGFYDLVIGNWPFSEVGPADRRYNRLNPTLHDYFFLKALDQTRPGGLVVGITTHGTMDKKGVGARMEMARKAELVAAFRLPTGAFQEYAGTKVVTDIIILRKRAEPVQMPTDAGWIDVLDHDTAEGTRVPVNEYFHKNPSHVIGRIDFGHGTTTFRPGQIVHRPDDMMAQLRRIVDLVPEGAFQADQRGKQISYVANHTSDRTNALVATDKGLFVIAGEYMAPANEVVKYALKSEAATAKREAELRSLIDMRKLYGALIDAQHTGEAAEQRAALRKAYEGFTKDHGPINESFGLAYLKKLEDPFYPALAALEIKTVNAGGKATYRPAKILRESTVRGARTMDSPSITDAFVLARNESVNPSLERMAELAKSTPEKVREELVRTGAGFTAPNGDFVPSDIYLSGNVREKFREAKAALEAGDKAMAHNVEALESVLPPLVPHYKIETQMGATWVPSSAYAEYIAHMLGLESPSAITVNFKAGAWEVNFDSSLNHRPQARSGFGSENVPFKRLVRAAIGNQTINVKRKDSDGNEYVDDEATKEVNAKISDMRTRFGEWLWKDPARRLALEAEYNEVRNAYATPRFDGSFMNMQGMALTLGDKPFNLRQHQVNAIWRALVKRKSLNAHEVGTGKTFTMGGIAVESRRYGFAKKPLLFAHNANSKSVAAEIQQMYPAAQVLYIDNLSKENVKTRMMQIANDDWDVVVMPHSVMDRLGFKEETLKEMAREEIRELEIAAEDAAQEDGVSIDSAMWDDEKELAKLRSVTAKQLVKQRMKIMATIAKMAQRASRDGAVSFEDLGVDMVLVDEAHEFKKPPIATRMMMKGLQKDTSDRSLALMFITRYIRSMHNGNNVHLFTGTPITNTMTEVFHMMRYMMQEEMEQASLADWDGWFGSFAREVTDVELSPAGEYEAVTRLQSFINVPELRRMIGQYMDVVFADDMPEMQPRQVGGKRLADKDLTEAQRAEILNGRTEVAMDRPYKKVINESSDMTPDQLAVFARVQKYAANWRNFSRKDRKDAMTRGAPESPIIHEGIAARASFDVRLVDAVENAGKEGSDEMTPHPQSKPARVVRNLLEVYRSHPKAAQVVFMEQGMAKSVTRREGPPGMKRDVTYKAFSTVADMIERLVAAGIPREQIALVDGSTSKDKRKEIADAMNSGAIRIVFGSTDSLGVGVNMQRNLRAMHHMDAPWMPGELEQRNGRGHRQGNQWNTVLEYRYLTDRLDGRRWQVLSIKQKFITAFMKSTGDDRVIEGDAASDEGSDILSTFGEAAGDPRVLMREKFKKKIEQLRSRERIHAEAVVDAQRRIDNSKRDLADAKRRLGDLRRAGIKAKIEQISTSMAGDGFVMTIDGTAYTKRADAAEALHKLVNDQLRLDDDKEIGEFGGEPLYASWPRLEANPYLYMRFGEGVEVESVGPSIPSLERSLRSTAERVEARYEKAAAGAEEAIKHAEAVVAEPFHLEPQLLAAVKALNDIEVDLAQNPVAPPFWLRSGAPMDTDVYRDGKAYTVTGHRWADDGFYVLAKDARGDLAIPYLDVRDSQGMPLYEEHEHAAPKVITAEEKKAADAGAASRGATNPAGIDRQAAEQALADIRRALPHAPPIELHESVEDAPAGLQKFLASHGAEGDVEAAFHDGKIHVFRPQFDSIERLQFVVGRHEVRHYGFRQLLGDQREALMLRIHGTNAKVREAVARRQKAYPTEDRARAVEEVLADMPAAEVEGLRGWRSLVAAVRDGLRRLADKIRRIAPRLADAIEPSTWTDDDVAALVAKAENVSRGGAGGYLADAAAMSRRGTAADAIAAGFTMKAYRGVSASNPFNDTGTTWLTTIREVAESYAEEAMGYEDPAVLEVMVKPDGLPRHDASRLTDDERDALQADEFGNPQAVGIYDRSDDHPLGGSRRNVTVIHAPNDAVWVIRDGATPMLSRAPKHDPDTAAALAKAGIRAKPGIKQQIAEHYSRAVDALRSRDVLANEFRQGALDQFHGINKAVQRDVGGMPVDQDPYIAARLANGGTSSVMRALLLHGQAVWAANGQHLEKKPGTIGLLDILAPLGEDVHDFFGWMIGNRAARLMKEGRENNFTEDDIKRLQALATPSNKGKFQKAAMQYAEFKRSVLDVAQAAGLIDPEGRKAWDYADYIPFYRQMDEKAVFSPTGKKGLAGQSSGIRSLKGGTAGLNDPVENLLMNFSRLIDASLKNNAIRKTVDLLVAHDSQAVQKIGYDLKGAILPAEQVRDVLEKAGTPPDLIDVIPPEAFEGMAKMWALQAPAEPDVVRIMVGGKPQFYRVHDPMLLKSLTSFVPFDFPGLALMRGAKRLLTNLVTSTPEFIIRNWMRDSLAAQAITRDGFNPAKSIQGIVKSFRETGAAEVMLFAGASFGGGHANASDPAGGAAELRRALRAKGMQGLAADKFVGTVLDTPAKVWDQYRRISDAVENSSREAVFEAATNAGRGATAAAYEAKDLMDFSLRGGWAAYQVLADVLPFFNARVQGLYRLGRSDPKRLAMVGGLMAVASIILGMANDGEDWYEELPDWDKDTYWHFKIGGHHFRIPKPFEVGVMFATFPERIGRSIKGLDAGKKTASRLWSNVRDQLAFDPVPQLFRPALNVWVNWDSFRDSPIETQGDEKKLPHARYSGRTSDTMKVLTGAAAPVTDPLGLSPKRLEYLLNGYFGAVGGYALQFSDMVVRKAQDKPAGPTLRADDLPIVKSFYRVDPARSTVYESDFYKMREEADKLAATFNAMKKDNPDQAKAIADKDGKKLAVRKVLDSTGKQLSSLNKMRDAILEDRAMSPAEKRTRLDQIQLQKNALVKATSTNKTIAEAF